MLSIMKKPRTSAAKLLKAFISFTTCFMAYKALTIISWTANPLTVVLSGSMEPAFARGDLLLVWGTSSPAVGDIVICNVDHMPFPIVHRVIRTFVDEGQTKLLTKGDNNNVDDTGLYPEGQDYLSPDAVVGSVFGMIPFVGYVTVIMSDYHWLRTVLLGFIALYTLLHEGKDDSCTVCSDRIESGDTQEPSTPEEAPAHTAENICGFPEENRSDGDQWFPALEGIPTLSGDDSCCSSDHHDEPFIYLSTSTASPSSTTDDSGTIKEFQTEEPGVVMGGEVVFITGSTDLAQLMKSG